jgi:uncharacterized protein YjbJ (UPF0337 family)
LGLSKLLTDVPTRRDRAGTARHRKAFALLPGRHFAARRVQGTIPMGEMTEKTKGLGNEIAGKTKQVVADATDNPKLKVEGDLQQAKGKVQNAAGTVMGALGDKV